MEQNLNPTHEQLEALRKKADAGDIESIHSLIEYHNDIINDMEERRSDGKLREFEKKYYYDDVISNCYSIKGLCETGAKLNDSYCIYQLPRTYELMIRAYISKRDLESITAAYNQCPYMIEAAKRENQTDNIIDIAPLYMLYGSSALAYVELLEKDNEPRYKLIEVLRVAKRAYESVSPSERSTFDDYGYHLTWRYLILNKEDSSFAAYFTLLQQLLVHINDLNQIFRAKLYYHVSEAYANGWGVSENKERFYEYVHKAAELGDEEAIALLSKENGSATNRNTNQSKQIGRLFFSLLLIGASVFCFSITRTISAFMGLLYSILLVIVSIIVARGFTSGNKSKRVPSLIALFISVSGLIFALSFVL
ncbi:MAG: hypothetical protein Q4A88_04830 [Clostridia bacterium]|nr:hypothetical protein [Clostridia bacterium]